MSRETKVPAIPAVTKDNVVEVLQAIKDTLEVREGKRGDELDQMATFRDLVALELVNTGGSVSRVGAGGTGSLPVVPPGWGDNSYNPETDFSIPQTPTNLIARPGISDVLLFWDNATYKNHAYTEIWRSETDNLGDAIRIATTSAFSYSDAVTEGRTYYYWVRFVSSANVIGAYNATSGTIAITELNPERLLALLTGQITESQLYQDLGARIDLIDDPTTGLVRKVNDLEDIVGEVTDAADYAAEAAASAAAAVQAKTDALLAETGAETARDAAISAQTSAQTSAANASTSAGQASQSATSAAGSASSASQSATTASNAANAAGGSASAAATSASNAATYATNAETASTASQSAKVAAESARDAASSSATAAAQSASTATTKATEAGQSANAASTSATNAATSAGNASTSASQASSSATNAQGSASNAATSATAAANSATSAQNSATAAATSASTATTKATEAENSASAATAAKVSAESARDSATTSASAAATSASTATTKASEASQSATSASQSATQASTNAANALTYRNDAASSASTATTKASEASTSAGAAATSAANASNSASAASNSAQTATTKATEAGASATAASTSATNAATSASTAAILQNNAVQASVDAQGYANSAAAASTSAANSLAQLQATATGFDSASAWNFDSSVDGWSTSSGSLAYNAGVVRISSTGSGQILRSPTGLTIVGAQNNLIRARVKRISGSGWQGTAFYTTSGHGEVLGYRKVITDTTTLNEWRILEWDMSTLNEGGSDWTNSTITRVRLDLGASFSDVFDIDWIAVGRVAPQAYTAAIAQEASVRAQADGALNAQYTVKIDTNGYVSGFGLASEAPVNGTPTSAFAVRADRFYIASPSGPGISPAMPFIVQTTPTTINGESVPAGVYMDTAYIRKGTITSAYIGDLAAGKITAGTISAAVTMTTPVIKSGAGATFGSTGFFLGYDGATPKLYAGNGSTQFISWNGSTLSVGGTITANAGVIGGNTITSSAISSPNYIQNFSGWTIKSDGTAEFRNILARGDIQASSLQTNVAMVNTANIVDAAITNAKIGNAQITTAKIGDAQVETLKIAGDAVTVPRFAEGISTGHYITSNWTGDLLTINYDVSGLNNQSAARVLIIAVVQVYSSTGNAISLDLGIFAGGALNTVVASTFTGDAISMTSIGSWMVGDGSYSASIRARSAVGQAKSDVSFICKLIALTAKR